MPIAAPRAAQALVVYAKNLKRVSAFYERVLALRAAECTADHVVLTKRGVELTIVAIPNRISKTIRITRPPQAREETPLKPVFTVKSLEALRVTVKATGGVLQPLEHAWRFRGTLVLDGWDPEGNVVQFRQRTR